MQIIDNVLSDSIFDKVQSDIFSSDFPWYYSGTSYYDANKTKMSWSHMVTLNGVGVSFISEFLENTIKNMMVDIGQPINNLHRIRLGLLTITDKNYINDPHVDSETPHKTGLLYLNDSDADTFIYDEQYDNMSGLCVYDYYKEVLNKRLTIFLFILSYNSTSLIKINILH
jgi:hypothetical protein